MLNFIQKNFIKINLNKMILMKTEAATMFIGRERELASLKEFTDISIVNNIVDSGSADRYINK